MIIMFNIERVARWLWRRDAREGQMVGTFEEQRTFWMREARKIKAIAER
jgi:hypothetical protein